MSNLGRNLFLWLVVIITIVFIFRTVRDKGGNEYYVNDFLADLQEGRIQEITLSEDKATVKKRVPGPGGETESFAFSVTPEYVDDLTKEVADFNGRARESQFEPVKIIHKASPTLLLNFFTIGLPALLMIGFLIFFLRQMQMGGSKAMSFGKSRARLNTEGKNRVTFADVAGCDEAKEELQEVVEFLKDARKFQRLGGKIPKGVLLFGAPGTGKTLLARAVAGEANVPFFSISGSDFVEMFVGVGASRVRDLFEQGKKNAPCIIFIDEIDAVGRHRFAGIGGGHDEREQTLNQLLVEMDGFNANEGVILVAATNRPDVLDPALLRPGRFDRQITVDSPDLKGRKEIFRVHTVNIVLDRQVDLEVLARRTPGFSGADIANAVNEAALLAARQNKDSVGMDDFEDAIDRVVAGPEKKSRVMSDKEKRVIAYHEAGHALMHLYIEEVDPLHKVSILPRGRALGYTMHLPMDDKYLTSKPELLGNVCALLGGRVAEEIVFGDITTGATNDLDRSTAIVHKMVCEFGMSDRLGPLTFSQGGREVFLGRDLVKERPYSEEIAREIDKEVRSLIDSCYVRAKDIVGQHRDQLDAIANALLEREVLEKDQVYELLGLTPPEEEPGAKEGDKAGQDSPRVGTKGKDPGIGGLDNPAPQPA